jgi:hypothetical protein
MKKFTFKVPFVCVSVCLPICEFLCFSESVKIKSKTKAEKNSDFVNSNTIIRKNQNFERVCNSASFVVKNPQD